MKKQRSILLKLLGENHPYTLESAASLALIFGEQGKWNEAKATLASMSILPTMDFGQGRFDEVMELAVQVIEGIKLQLGEDHPHIIMSMYIAAQIYKSQGKLNKALELLELLVQKNRANLGETHPNIIQCIHDLVESCLIQGRVCEAGRLLAQMIEGWEGGISNNLVDRTEKLLVEVLKKGRESETVHLDIHASLNNLATIYWIQGEQEKAEIVSLQAMDGRDLQVTGSHTETLKTMDNLAYIHTQDKR